ncbi:MAG: hypothetical protein ACRDSP_13050 [Pseudonocardiaceae bacterium]
MNPAQTSGRSPLAAPDTAPPQAPEQPPDPGYRLRMLRRLSGLLTGGLVVLATTVGVAQWLIGSSGGPGPGIADVAGHVAGALAAIGLQVVVDRSRGPRAVLAALAILVVVAVVLWFGWWS